MITKAILDVVFGVFKVIIDFIPSFSFFGDFESVITQVVSFLAWSNYYVPLEDFFAASISVLGVWVVCACTSFFLQIF